ncbi:outer membrane protein assembly factor BamD [Rhodovulum sp. DZ06]|uniref:outer membrane protein assembly factor BamD n=1 Tax=Rhodovulum sp. DZ06 TaxID=3425126 RepID=UPI003D35130B
MRRPTCRSALRLATVAALGLSLSACSMFGDGAEKDPFSDPYAGRSAAEIYAQAEAQLEDGEAVAAGETLEELERVHPYSEWAKRAMILSAYAYHQAGEMDRARLAAQRFIDFFPSDSEAPYAQYLIGLTWYDEIVDVARDQRSARKALEELQKVVSRYPGSAYAREAQLKIDLCNDQLAGKEMMIGRYYLGQAKRIAAINRFKTVLTRYQTTSHAPEALHRLVEAYLELGLESEARTAAAVLGHNFPGSDWYQASYALMQGADLAPFEDEESWISRAFRQITTGSTL